MDINDNKSKQVAPNNIILNCVDGFDLNDEKVRAESIAIARLEARVWPLYQGTRLINKISTGDRCLFYIGGGSKVASSFVGTAMVESVVIAPREWEEPTSCVPTKLVFKLLKLRDVVLWKPYIPIRPFLDKLSFITNKDRWGLHMMGGARYISNEDYILLENSR